MLFPLRYELPLAGVIYPHLKRGNIQQGGRKVNFTQLHDSPVQGPVLHWGLTPAAPCQAGRGEGIPLPGCGAVGPAAPASLMARPAPSLSHLVPSAAPAALRPVRVRIARSGCFHVSPAAAALPWRGAQHGKPNETVLQSTACRFTSAQMETELSGSLSPRPARRQYLS